MRRKRACGNYSDPVAVGDLARIEFDRRHRAIAEILPRKNAFSRKEKGRNRKEDVIASNLDRIIIIQSFDIPGSTPFRRPPVCPARKDESRCCSASTSATWRRRRCHQVMEYYDNAPIDLALVSARTGRGMDDFAGHRGVPRSWSGIRARQDQHTEPLYRPRFRVSEISKAPAKGATPRPMSRCSVPPTGPGSSIRPDCASSAGRYRPETAGDYFYEFGELARECAFRPCSHDHEPDCGVKRMLEEGRIHEDRYISYLNILQSLRETRERKYQ